MHKQLDFYFDFGSPTAYLAHCRLQQLSDQYDLTVNYRPMLLGGVFKATANTSPVDDSRQRRLYAAAGPAPFQPPLRRTVEL